MSRPFSYNDENFTVIGNVLFVHIIDNKARKQFEPVVEVPPAIFERLKTYTNFCIISYINFNDQESQMPGSEFTIINIENKHYLVFGVDRPLLLKTNILLMALWILSATTKKGR